MQVNTSIWGAPESWVDGTTTEKNADIKYPETTKNTYRKQYNSSSIPWNSIDLSPAFWGIGKGSILCQPHYLSAHTPNGELNNIEVTTERVFEPLDKPLIFLQAYNTSFSSTFRYNNRYRYIDGDHQTTSYPSGRMYTDKVMMTFNYQKVMAFGFVRRVANLSASPFYTDLQTLIDNFDSYIGQYITSFSYGIRFGDGETNRTSAATGCFLPFIPFEIPGKSISYNNVSFYATAEGMAIAPMSSSSGNSTIPFGIGNINDAKGDATVGDSTTGFAYRYCKGASTDVPIYYYDDTNPLWTIAKTTRVVSSSQTNWMYAPVIEITAENKDNIINYILSQMAFIGLPFTTSSDRAARGKIGDVGVYLPVFDQNGVTTGDYAEGTNALRLPNAQWVDGRESGYDPNRPTDEGDYGDLSNRIPSRFAVGGLGLYVTNYQTLYSLQQFLNGTYAPTQDALTADFKGTNPQDYIISIQKYPSDALLPTSATQSDIYIGKIDSTFDAYKLIEPPGTQLGHYSFGELTVGSGQIPTYGDFRDYQSKITLLMPFVGTAELDPRLYVGHSIGLDYVIDYLTGSVAAEIKRDGLTIETKASKLSISVPFLAGNMGQYQNQLAQLEMSIEQSKIKQITGAVTTVFSIGGAAATVAGGGSELAGLGSGAGIIRGASNMLLERINQESLEYQVEHTQPSVGTISTASPGNAFEMDDRARLLIWRPYMLAGYDAAIYAHVVGHATLRAAQLSSFSGLTVAASAELSGIYTIDGTKAATEQELQMIKRALLVGVYV